MQDHDFPKLPVFQDNIVSAVNNIVGDINESGVIIKREVFFKKNREDINEEVAEDARIEAEE
jgi:hypothetical protein